MIFSQVSLYFFRLLAFKDFLHFAQVIIDVLGWIEWRRGWKSVVVALGQRYGACVFDQETRKHVWPAIGASQSKQQYCWRGSESGSWQFTWHRSTTRAKGAATNSRHTSCCSTRSWPGKTVTGRNVWCASATPGCAIWRPAAFLVWTSYMVYGISWSFPLRRWSTFFETRGSHRSRWSVSIPSHAWWTGLQCWRWICGCTSTWRSNTALANCSL